MSEKMSWSELIFLFLINVASSQYLSQRSYYNYPWGVQPSFQLPSARVICSACSCNDDFFCSWNCNKCKTVQFCSECACLYSLGCARNCGKCSTGSSDSSISDPPNVGHQCLASSGPAAGQPCIFPFIFNGVRYDACAPLYGTTIASAYNQVSWCSTRVDINGFHVRGPWNNKGKYVGICDDTCPRVSGTYYWL